MEEDQEPTGESPAQKAEGGRARSKSHSTGVHKRTPSGNILTKLGIFRSSPESTPPPATDDEITPFPSVPDVEDDDQPANPVLAGVLEAQGKGRKRKGSLRKTALLGTGKLRLDRRSSNADQQKPRSPTKLHDASFPKRERKSSQTAHTKSEYKTYAFEFPTPNSSSETFGSRQPQLHVDTSSHFSTLTSPSGPYASTTDDDDSLTLASSMDSSLLAPPLKRGSQSPSPTSSESSVTDLGPQQRRRLTIKTASKSPLAVPHASPSPLPTIEEWDYSATEWWGWIILLVTWVVVVVGMGSCLEVWSWAWDVGETPYAPPELEDDPTLPIVGYYPALMVLTAVMSWVWVVVAWVGMKYFKHAKIQGEDT